MLAIKKYLFCRESVIFFFAFTFVKNMWTKTDGEENTELLNVWLFLLLMNKHVLNCMGEKNKGTMTEENKKNCTCKYMCMLLLRTKKNKINTSQKT